MSDADIDCETAMAVHRHLRAVDREASEDAAFDLLDDRYQCEEFTPDAVVFLGEAIRAQLDVINNGALSAMRGRFDGQGAEALRIARTKGSATLDRETGAGTATTKRYAAARLAAFSAHLPFGLGND